ncbi:methylenetetrahydrofolate reductase [NAD(P)H] [Bengtsoniella intestinalis]|uniref:methylenetetrahydrofolate reductase [NAD(P)H] n=1 Tax=Bengtsoniella intestinalis TaxID=3073143 RepID=UPI00391F06C8
MKISSLLAQRPTVSFEIFPPKKESGDLSSIYENIAQLAELKPDFISVTYGAGGSTTDYTVEIAAAIKEKYGVEAVAHLSCIDATADHLHEILGRLKAANIENILALRGDYPQGYDPITAPREFQYASDLDAFIKAHYGDTFCLSGACYPEVHQEADSLEADLDAMEAKVKAGADYLITQIFFDNRYYYRLVREARNRGITVPILAGIMPVINGKQLIRIAHMSGCSIPYELSAMIERFNKNQVAMGQVGVNYASNQIMDLITNGVDGIHLYTMNRPAVAKEIMARTGAILDVFTGREHQ